MKIAVEGCAHGELDKIYDTIAFLEKKENVSINLLLCCGDFQSVRNKADLQCMAVPPKYQKLNSFYKYYSGEKKAPILTIFIGGNHEASNYLQELPYGGWVAPNIYYLGYAGIVRYGGVRIGGLSGIFKSHDYLKGHYEHPPYTNETKRSAYHVRNLEVFRLKQITTHIDIFMSHDWPKGIYNHGNVEQLLKKKSFFREEVENNQLGSPAAAELMYKLKPSFWFSAHLHVKFPVVVEHQVNETNCTKETKFLALDKCLPNRDFLQVFDFPHDNDMDLKEAHLELDPEWLAILRSTNPLLNLTYKSNYMPGQGSDERWQFTPTEDEIAAINTDFGGDFSIPENFVQTVASHDSSQPNKKVAALEIQINPQTELICAMLGITNPNAVFLGKDNTYDISDIIVENRGEISSSALDDDVLDDDDEEFTSFIVTPTKPVHDPAEISLDELDDSEDAQYTDTETADSSDALCTDDGTDDVPSTDTSYEELNIKSFNSLSSSLSLPFPKNSDCESKDDSLLDISFSSESNVPYSPSLTSAKSSDSLSDTDAEQLDKKEPANFINSRSTSSESEPPIKKIFKRRNMALFTNSEEESQ